MPSERPKRSRGRSSRPLATNDLVRQIQAKLNRVFLWDAESLRRRLTGLRKELGRLQTRENANFDDWNKRASELSLDCDLSIERVEKRRESIPKIEYDLELPVVERREEIKKLIAENQVAIVCGETGSGKSTQLPKICLELGLGTRGLIGHTQPRRIAARSIASRVADELRVPLGKEVGYKIRFSDETSDKTLVKLMTDGVLLAETRSDRYFDKYEVVIVDEAHERSLNIDFLLGMLRRVLERRRDLKVIVTSATIDAERFAQHFASAKGPAPIVEVSGRTYPIEIVYRPVDEWKLRREAAALERGESPSKTRDLDDEDAFEATLCDAVDEMARRGNGDMLIFMPTERDIFETAKLLKGRAIPGDDAVRKTTILPLYARLSSDEQQKIFGKTPHRKIVVATNVAESSLTVPGIRYVIDAGTARISRYSARTKTQRLPIEPISRASADQRAGRCGRVGPGVCVRLYDERDYLQRPKYTTPEIQRSNLASVILQTKALRLGDVALFPFIDPPSRASVEDGYKTLFELGAVDERNELTKIGETLSRLPVDPRIGRMLLAANEENALRETLVIASALEILDPRERPREKREAADLKHERFLDENSDFLSYLKLWDFWRELKLKLSKNQLRKACRENFLSYNRMREWSDVYLQLSQLTRELKFESRPRRDDYDAIHRSVLTGLLYGIALKSETGSEYKSTNSGKFLIWPGSGLKKKPEWLVGAERIETTRSYLRTVAKIDPAWIEELGAHIIDRTRRDPFWNRETGKVHAYEKVSLRGLTLIPRRRINYGPIDPVKAREIFIYEALVNQDFDCSLPFFDHNRKIREEAEDLRDKMRRHDFVKSLDAVYDFYDARLPERVYDWESLKKWHRTATPPERKALFATLPDFCAAEDVDETTMEAFPDALVCQDSTRYPLEYAFKPGEEDDGVTIVAPIEGLRQLDSRKLGWLVPGLLEQKVVALLKSLPKEIRRELVPVPETAKTILRDLRYGTGSLEEALAREVSRIAGKRTTVDDFDASKLPKELRFNVKVVDDKGEVLDEGRDPEELRKRLGVEMKKSLESTIDPKWTRDGIVKWDFAALPDSVSITRGGATVSAYPAPIDPRFASGKFAPDAGRPKTVSLRLFDSRDKAMRAGLLGVERLFVIANWRDLKTQARHLPFMEKMRAISRSIPGFDVDEGAAELIGRIALDANVLELPRDEGDYNRAAARGRERIGLATQDATGWLSRFLDGYHEARLATERRRGGPASAVCADVDRQIGRLLEPGFYLTVPWERLKEYPRYFKAIVLRFDKWTNGGSQTDPQFAEELENYWRRFEEASARAEAAGVIVPELETFRWALEEYRVSLFAQRLGTAMKVSPVRLEKIWEKATF
ncbi:MAG: ATP-dependent RNA helicase HrpA [Thermoguttaceae bacterium]|nr:ATP-dependent RNA helicase HrpA [Thermoguttaceae bacterium]